MGNLLSVCIFGDEEKPKSFPNQSKNIHEDYGFGKELGKGAYGTVVLGIDLKSKEEYAIKMVERADMTEEDEEDLALEVSVLQKLQHKYVMNLIRYYETPECHYLVTELLVGGELFDRIEKKQHYSEKEAKDVMFIFFEAMAYVHKNNVVHRDLKPENLLLMSKEDDEHLKIADFGLAGIIKNGQPLEGIAGTPLYMSPEMVSNEPYSFPTDVWSMGVICFILLGGYPPFYANDINTLLTKIKNGEYEFDRKFWGTISPGAKELIQCMLEHDPKKRITIMEAMDHPWIKSSDEALAARSLATNHKEFKKFNAKRRWKAAAKAVITLNTLQHKAHISDIQAHK